MLLWEGDGRRDAKDLNELVLEDCEVGVALLQGV